METTLVPTPPGERARHANGEDVSLGDGRVTDCFIVGGGPGGAVLALLLARQGVDVTLLEAHQDFDRDFRGDTVHPSTLELLEQLDLLQRLLELPHARLADFPIHFPDGKCPECTPASPRAPGRWWPRKAVARMRYRTWTPRWRFGSANRTRVGTLCVDCAIAVWRGGSLRRRDHGRGWAPGQPRSIG